jgi:hypothetical protein
MGVSRDIANFFDGMARGGRVDSVVSRENRNELWNSLSRA